MGVVGTLCPGTALFKYDLGCGASEQDDFTLLQGKAEFTEWRQFYVLSTQDTGRWTTSRDIIILFRRSDGKTDRKGEWLCRNLCTFIYSEKHWRSMSSWSSTVMQLSWVVGHMKVEKEDWHGWHLVLMGGQTLIPQDNFILFRYTRSYQKYCRIQINSSVTRHRGYLTCRNLVLVMHHRWALAKGLNCDTHPYMAISIKNTGFLSINP